jgi:hypothetical protein
LACTAGAVFNASGLSNVDTSRDPLSLVNMRAGLDDKRWSVMAWSKNLTNKQNNAEFSPGGFLWKAEPRRMPTALELEMCRYQGEHVGKITAQMVAGKAGAR